MLSIILILSGSFVLSAGANFSAGIVVSESNTATLPYACTPASVLLAPIVTISSLKRPERASFTVPSIVGSSGWY